MLVNAVVSLLSEGFYRAAANEHLLKAIFPTNLHDFISILSLSYFKYIF